MAKCLHTKFEAATSRYGAHMGDCQHFPALASAWFEGGARIEISAAEYPDMEPAALIAKAVAILRNVTRVR